MVQHADIDHSGLTGVAGPIPPTIEAIGGSALVQATNVGAANRGIRRPIWVPMAVSITHIGVLVAVQSGNISVAVYNSAKSRVATSGAVACPAVGYQAVALTAPYAAAAGTYYIALSCDNTTATFQMINYSGVAAPFAQFMNTAHPLPSTFTDGGLSRGPYLCAIVATGISGPGA